MHRQATLSKKEAQALGSPPEKLREELKMFFDAMRVKIRDEGTVKTSCSALPFRSRVSVGAPQELMSSPDFGGFSASGQPSAGRELGDPIDREVSQSRQGRAKIVANRNF